jgi:hypothetical protein
MAGVSKSVMRLMACKHQVHVSRDAWHAEHDDMSAAAAPEASHMISNAACIGHPCIHAPAMSYLVVTKPSTQMVNTGKASNHMEQKNAMS